MMDLNSSPLLLEAQLAERRREIAAAKANSATRTHQHPQFRAAFADLLAHLALHLDRRAVGVVVARHPHTGQRG